MRRIFVTSSGTGIGKTLVTEELCRQAMARTLSVRAQKPVLSGFSAQDGDSDAHRILAALGTAPTPEAIAAMAPFRFRAPLSPDMAAAREGRRIEWDALLAACAPKDEDLQVIEGVGGVMVPLDESRTVLDWMAALGIPALLVVGSYLGTLSHGLTAALALRSRGVPLAGVVVSESEEQPVPLAETVATFRRFLPGVTVVALGRQPGGAVPDLVALAAP